MIEITAEENNERSWNREREFNRRLQLQLKELNRAPRLTAGRDLSAANNRLGGFC